jgi:hypothetical protein
MKNPKIQELKFDGKVYKIGYCVTTRDMKSLGLRKNPNIIQYEIGKWIFSPDIKNGICDDGGICFSKDKLRK